MKVINQKNNDPWAETELAFKEDTSSGYKMACLEAEKVFKSTLRDKGYPSKNINQTILYFGWRVSDKNGLKKALTKTAQIRETFDYQLSSFETEDIIASFKQASIDFSEKKSLSWQRKVALFYKNYLSIRTSFLKKLIITVLLFFLTVKFLSRTDLGHKIVNLVVDISDLFFSWFMIVLALLLVILLITIISFAFLESKKTKPKESSEKRT
ncbi:MAG: hypothetical protein WCI63_00695 [bacterium]